LGIEAAQVDAESFPVSNMQTVPALPPECPADKEAAQADAVCQPVTNRTRAYLKIEDGCDRRCTYCVIPLARGKVRSRPMETVLTEAKTLIDAGYKEIVLTGINTALYGNDFSHYRNQGDGIVDIVNQLASLSGDFRIRLNSLEPTVVDAACVKTLSACERLCAHFHLSLQSGSDRVLKAMGRPYRMRDYMEIVEALRARDADVAITTDLIIGFPGETRADFEESLKAVRDIGFARIHVFKYSRRPQTAAAEMREQVSEAIKAERSRALIDVGLETAAAFRAQNAGKTRQALFLERGQDDFYTGMTDNDLEIRLQSKKDLTNQLLDITLSAEILRTDMAYREKQAKGAPC
jgi:threonylcarbamoyladenosine tRNA methylthiotransferase MtaB